MSGTGFSPTAWGEESGWGLLDGWWAMPVVVRAVVFEYDEVARDSATVSAAGIAKWLGGASEPVTVNHSVLRVRRVGLLVQKPPDRGVRVYWEPVTRLLRVGGRLCRYHEGPPGVPEEQVYCIRPATTPSGFCDEHAKSPMALYERCAAGSDEACLRVAAAWPGEVYAVYVLDYGSERVKVGLTRGWRVLWRAAEQPHIGFAVVKLVEGDLYAARSFEKELGKHRAATEGAGVRTADRLLLAATMLEKVDAHKLAARMAEHLVRLGLKGSFNSYTVLPKTSPGEFLKARRASVMDLLGRRLVVLDYWAGLLLVEDLDTGERLAIAKNDIQHLVLYTGGHG